MPLIGAQKEKQDSSIASSFLALIDISEYPKLNNDREAKLGKYQASQATSVFSFNSTVRKRKINDGLETLLDALRPFEPDLFTLRDHRRDGEGIDVVWSLCLKVDHTNKQADPLNRSTIIRDEAETQRHSDLHSVFRIAQVEAVRDFYGEYFDEAGLPKDLRKSRDAGDAAIPKQIKAKAKVSTWHTAFNIGLEAGYVADKERVGQFQQIFALVADLQIPSEDVENYMLTELALRTDVKFTNGVSSAPLSIVLTSDILGDMVIVNSGTTMATANPMASDALEDSKAIAKKTPTKWLRPTIPKEKIVQVFHEIVATVRTAYLSSQPVSVGTDFFMPMLGGIKRGTWATDPLDNTKLLAPLTGIYSVSFMVEFQVEDGSEGLKGGVLAIVISPAGAGSGNEAPRFSVWFPDVRNTVSLPPAGEHTHLTQIPDGEHTHDISVTTGAAGNLADYHTASLACSMLMEVNAGDFFQLKIDNASNRLIAVTYMSFCAQYVRS